MPSLTNSEVSYQNNMISLVVSLIMFQPIQSLTIYRWYENHYFFSNKYLTTLQLRTPKRTKFFNNFFWSIIFSSSHFIFIWNHFLQLKLFCKSIILSVENWRILQDCHLLYATIWCQYMAPLTKTLAFLVYGCEFHTYQESALVWSSV